MESTTKFEKDEQEKVFEESGLIVTFDEENSELKFEWDSEKNPEWNYLLDVDKKELVNRMFKHVEIDHEEKSND